MATFQAAADRVTAEVKKRVEAKGVDFDAAVQMFKDEMAKAKP